MICNEAHRYCSFVPRPLPHPLANAFSGIIVSLLSLEGQFALERL